MVHSLEIDCSKPLQQLRLS